MKIIKSLGQDVPSDSRALLQTPRSIPVEAIGENLAWYREPSEAVRILREEAIVLSIAAQPLEIQLSSDGVALWKHSAREFYPVFLKLHTQRSRPLVFALHYGKRPSQDYYEKCLNFLLPYFLSGELCLKAVVADLPARQLMKQCRGHTSFHSCEFCLSVGRTVERTVVFPEVGNGLLLTDVDFATQKYPEKHIQGMWSPFLCIPHDIVLDWPIDYMHCVCAGVTNRMLDFMEKEGPLVSRIRANQKREISERLLEIDTPSDFQRTTRPFSEWRHWSTTEKRMFLMYTGLFTMKDIVAQKVWDAWALLSAAVHLLCRPFPGESDIANAERFIKDHHQAVVSREALGLSFPTLNSHLLFHLPDCVRRHGHLDLYSAFPFENYNQTLKKYLNGRKHPVQEVIGRLLEEEKLNLLRSKRGPGHFRVKDSKMSSEYPDNHWGVLGHGGRVDIVKIRRVLDGHVVRCQVFEKSSAFSLPFDSAELHIYKLERIERLMRKFSITDILFKCYILKNESENLCWSVPLAHSF